MDIAVTLFLFFCILLLFALVHGTCILGWVIGSGKDIPCECGYAQPLGEGKEYAITITIYKIVGSIHIRIHRGDTFEIILNPPDTYY